MTITKTITVMNTNDVCKFPSIEGRREMSVGCDDERFISPKEYCEASYRGGSLRFPNRLKYQPHLVAGEVA